METVDGGRQRGAAAVGLVLAAGAGRRLGLGAKALLRSGGQTLVQRAVGVLRESGCAPVLVVLGAQAEEVSTVVARAGNRKSTRLNSSHVAISYAVFCLKKKKITESRL